MNFDEFDAVFDRFQATAFRLETLPRYAGDEDEEFAVFLAGEPLPERSTRTVPWLGRVADTTAAGARRRRVHALSRPLTGLSALRDGRGYEANIDAGEDVRIADRCMHPELAALRQDFRLFDAETPDAFAMPCTTIPLAISSASTSPTIPRSFDNTHVTWCACSVTGSATMAARHPRRDLIDRAESSWNAPLVSQCPRLANAAVHKPNQSNSRSK